MLSDGCDVVAAVESLVNHHVWCTWHEYTLFEEGVLNQQQQWIVSSGRFVLTLVVAFIPILSSSIVYIVAALCQLGDLVS